MKMKAFQCYSTQLEANSDTCYYCVITHRCPFWCNLHFPRWVPVTQHKTCVSDVHWVKHRSKLRNPLLQLWLLFPRTLNKILPVLFCLPQSARIVCCANSPDRESRGPVQGKGYYGPGDQCSRNSRPVIWCHHFFWVDTIHQHSYVKNRNAPIQYSYWSQY